MSDLHTSLSDKQSSLSDEQTSLSAQHTSMNEDQTCNILLTGVGGQGVVLLSRVISETAHRLGQGIVVSEIHGMAQRGGIVQSVVRIGPTVNAPMLPSKGADLLISTEPIEAYRARQFISKSTVVVTSISKLVPVPVILGLQAYPPMDKMLQELEELSGRLVTLDSRVMAYELGNSLVSNIIILGAAAGVRVLPLDTQEMLQTLSGIVPKKTIEANIEAFNRGFELANK